MSAAHLDEGIEDESLLLRVPIGEGLRNVGSRHAAVGIITGKYAGRRIMRVSIRLEVLILEFRKSRHLKACQSKIELLRSAWSSWVHGVKSSCQLLVQVGDLEPNAVSPISQEPCP